MKYWDASAIVPLILTEAVSESVRAEFERDPVIVTWWGTRVEVSSAMSRLERDGQLDERGTRAALDQLAALAAAWAEISPSSRLRQTAERLLRLHTLRAGDALQLAAAIVGSDGDPHSMQLVTADARLAAAARREGFTVVEPA